MKSNRLARYYNSRQYLLSGAFTTSTEALESEAGVMLYNDLLKKFKHSVFQTKRTLNFLCPQNEVSQMLGKAFTNFERVFNANDKNPSFSFKSTSLDAEIAIKDVLESFESNALNELKENSTVWVVIVPLEKDFKLLYLPVDSKFSDEYSEEGELIALRYDDIEVKQDIIKIKKKEYVNKTSLFPAVKLIEKEVKENVSWSPYFAFLGSLERLLINQISYDYQRFRSAYPVIVKIQSSCGYSDADGSCDNNVIKDKNNKIIKSCPNCGAGVGPGTELTLRQPLHDSKLDLGQAYREVSFDITPLNHNKESNREDLIESYEGITGFRAKKDETGNIQYQNRLSVIADSERAENVLSLIAKEFTRISRFLIEFVILSNNISNYTIDFDLGTDFYLKTVDDYLEEIKKAKEAGVPAYIINDLIRKVKELSFSKIDDVNELELWQLLEPYPSKTLVEIEKFAK